MEPYNCTVICSGPRVVHPLHLFVVCPHHVTSLGNASVISTHTMTHPLHVFHHQEEIMNYDTSLCPLDCMVAVADVCLLC